MRMEKEPTVSVVIAAYNRPDYLHDAIESAVKQTYPVEQIVVVDDCSPTDLKPTIEMFPDANILYHKKEKNLGVSNSRNIGLSLATGDYVSILDDDDIYDERKIEAQMQAILSTENCIASLTACSMIGSGTESGINYMSSGLIQEDDLRKGNPYVGLLAERRHFIEEPYDEDLTLGEDWDVYIRLKRRGEIYFCSNPLYFYRKGNHESLTGKAKKMKLEDVEHRLAVSYKNRDWLGEHYFNIRIARVMLSYIWVKSNKTGWIAASVKRAGLRATFSVLLSGVRSKLFRKKTF